jgi:hypothetical protein
MFKYRFYSEFQQYWAWHQTNGTDPRIPHPLVEDRHSWSVLGEQPQAYSGYVFPFWKCMAVYAAVLLFGGFLYLQYSFGQWLKERPQVAQREAAAKRDVVLNPESPEQRLQRHYEFLKTDSFAKPHR